MFLKDRFTYLLVFLFSFFILFLNACASMQEELGDVSGVEEETFEEGESDSSDSSEDFIQGIQLLKFATNSENDSGCATKAISYDKTVNHEFCFRGDRYAGFVMTLLDDQGEEIISMTPGSECASIELTPGNYTLEVCEPLDPDGDNIVFLAPKDVTADDHDFTDELDEDREYETIYDYESDELNLIRTLNQSEYQTFLSTNSCVRCDLTSANFSGLDLTNATLTRSNLTEANLSGATLSSATLTRARFRSANLTNAVLTGVAASGVDFQSATLDGATMTNGDFTYARFDSASLVGATGTSATMTRARFRSANLTNAKFPSANFTRARLEKSTCSGTDFSSANLSYVKAGKTNFSGAKLGSTNLTRAYFNSATMTGGVNLTASTIARTRFYKTDLTGADLTGATLTSPRWNGATLSGATWTDGTTCATPSVSKCQ